MSPLARLPAALCVAAATLAAGCSGGAGDADDVVSGERLTVYVSAPLRGSSGEDGRDIVDGAKLALLDAGAEAGGVEVEAVYMDDTSGDGEKARWDPVIVADNARRAAQDSTAIAYIGELESGATRISLPITNQAAMLHVSAASSAIDLVRESEGSGDDVPALFQPTGSRTFGRVVPGDDVQAEAGAALAEELGAGATDVVIDDTEFGELIAEEYEEALDVTQASEGERRAVTYFAGTGCPPPRTGGTVIANDSALAEGCDAHGLFITSATQDPGQLPAAGQDFVRNFIEAHDRRPGRYAAYGYEAMAVVLDAIDRASDPESRSSVIDSFFATEDRDSILGTYSIDALGQTTLETLAAYRIDAQGPTFNRPITLD